MSDAVAAFEQQQQQYIILAGTIVQQPENPRASKIQEVRKI